MVVTSGANRPGLWPGTLSEEKADRIGGLYQRRKSRASSRTQHGVQHRQVQPRRVRVGTGAFLRAGGLVRPPRTHPVPSRQRQLVRSPCGHQPARGRAADAAATGGRQPPSAAEPRRGGRHRPSGGPRRHALPGRRPDHRRGQEGTEAAVRAGPAAQPDQPGGDRGHRARLAGRSAGRGLRHGLSPDLACSCGPTRCPTSGPRTGACAATAFMA